MVYWALQELQVPFMDLKEEKERKKELKIKTMVEAIVGAIVETIHMMVNTAIFFIRTVQILHNQI